MYDPSKTKAILQALATVARNELEEKGRFVIPGVVHMKTRVKPGTQARIRIKSGKEVRIQAKGAKTVISGSPRAILIEELY